MITKKDLSEIVSGRVLENEPMSKHTTFRIGGPADFFVEPKTINELKALLKYLNGDKTPFFYIGNGSNLLVKDKGVHGVVIKLSGDLSGLKINESMAEVTAGGGCNLQFFVKECAKMGLSGVEPLAGIPGTLGGAIVMNAGTKDGYISGIVKSVTIIDKNGTESVLKREDLNFSYRSSNIPEKSAVVSAEFVLKRHNKDDIIKKINGLLEKRGISQPIGNLNAGCIFRNPEGFFASKMIDEAGLKGLKSGDAVVSEKHANFINNSGNATAEDVLKLIGIIKQKVKEKFGKELELEIKIIGS